MQHQPERMYTRHPRREAETEAEAAALPRACGGWPRKGASPGGPQTAPAQTVVGGTGGGGGGGGGSPDRKPGTDSALTRKPVTCWQPRSLPAVDIIVLKPLPNVRLNHRRYGQCPTCSGSELLHLQMRKHISVIILAARHMRQKQIHVPLGKEKEKMAHKRHDVGALTRVRRPILHHRHVVCVQEKLCVMPFLAPAMDGDRHIK